MQGHSEASLGCLQSKTFSCDSQNVGTASQGYLECKNENNMHSSVGVIQSGNLLFRGSSAAPVQGFYSPFHQQEFPMWSNFHSDRLKMLQNGLRTFVYPAIQEYSFPVASRTQYVPSNAFSPGNLHEFLSQEFQYFVVIDFEATCDREKNLHPQEIIEFPSVLVNSVTGQLEASFQTYVRPTFHQHLTDFCKELTGIQQIQVDRGVPLTEALLMHDKWLEDKGIKHTHFAVVTWSNWDCRVMLDSECRFKRIRKPPYFDRWINLRIPFHEVFGDVHCNLKEAVQLAGLTWEGRAHCGLDDARNTARLLSVLMHRGFKFSITDSLMKQPANGPPVVCHPQSDHLSAPIPQLQWPKQLAGPAIQLHPQLDHSTNERDIYCHCGVMTSKRMIRKPGPKHGCFFFGCGNWTATRGAVCSFFEWAS